MAGFFDRFRPRGPEQPSGGELSGDELGERGKRQERDIKTRAKRAREGLFEEKAIVIGDNGEIEELLQEEEEADRDRETSTTELAERAVQDIERKQAREAAEKANWERRRQELVAENLLTLKRMTPGTPSEAELQAMEASARDMAEKKVAEEYRQAQARKQQRERSEK